MKANEIKVGGLYTAKVNGKLTTVRVDAIRERYFSPYYYVTNIATGRKTTFSSAAKFHAVAETPEQRKARAAASIADMDARLLAMPEAAGLTPETEQHVEGGEGFVGNAFRSSGKCACSRCRIVRAMQRRAAGLTAENPYREGW